MTTSRPRFQVQPCCSRGPTAGRDATAEAGETPALRPNAAQERSPNGERASAPAPGGRPARRWGTNDNVNARHERRCHARIFRFYPATPVDPTAGRDATAGAGETPALRQTVGTNDNAKAPSVAASRQPITEPPTATPTESAP